MRSPSAQADAYRELVEAQLRHVAAASQQEISSAAAVAAQAIGRGGRLALFGCGHAIIPVLEMFCRGGGLVPVLPLFASGMMLWDWPVRRGFDMERDLPEYGRLLLEHAGLTADDVLLVFSTAGTIPIAVEALLTAGRIGAPTVAVTSVVWSRSLTPVHVSGKRVFEVADIVIDNCGGENYGAQLEVAPDVQAGPTASMADLFIANLLSLEIATRLREAGHEPPVLRSNHQPGGREHNEALLEAYRERLRWV